MKSSESKASPSRRPSGVDRTGLPAIVTNARICPRPGVSISSRMRRGRELAAVLREAAHPAAVEVEVARPDEAPRRPRRPPARGTSRRPARSKLPAEQVQAADRPRGSRSRSPWWRPRSGRTPRRRRRPQNSRASRAIVVRGHPAQPGGQLGGERRRRAHAAASTPSTYAGGSARPSASSGVQHREQHDGIGAGPDEVRARWRSWRSRSGAGRAPRSGRRASLIACARRGKSGAVISEPLEAIGLAPNTRKYDVRSRSGIGSSSWWPNSCHATSWWGTWSTVEAREPVAGPQRLHERHARGSPSRARGRWGCRGRRRRRRGRAGSAPRPARRRPGRGPRPSRSPPSRPPTPPDRAPQPVGVVVHVGERDALGADVAARERVVGVAPDRR